MTICTITGLFRDPAGELAAGEIIWTPNVELVDADGNVVVPRIPVTTVVDVDGVIDQDLVASEDLQPDGATYKVQVRMVGGVGAYEFDCVIPADASCEFAALVPERALRRPVTRLPNSTLAAMAAGTVKGRAVGAGTGAPQDLTASQARTVLGLGSAALAESGAFDAAGSAAAAQAAAIAASQPLDADLTAIAALSTTAFGRGVLVLADAAGLRTSAGLGGSATKDVGTTAGSVAAGDHDHTGVYDPAGTAAALITHGPFDERPPPGTVGALYIASDATYPATIDVDGEDVTVTGLVVFLDTGSAWTQLAAVPWKHARNHAADGNDPIEIVASQVADLGGAALLNVGAVAGTVAAGDDSRFPSSPPRPPIDVQVFTASGTWTKPTAPDGCDDYHEVEVLLLGGGGGGGSGRRGADGTVRCGGGGGGAAGMVRHVLDITSCGATETVDVGTGGSGGAAVTADNTDGNPGSVGVRTQFGATRLAAAAPGGGGGAGTATSGTAGASGSGTVAGQTGAAAHAAGGTGNTPTTPSTFSYASAGGAGGGVAAANTAQAGGAGGTLLWRDQTGGAAGTTNGGAGGAGAAPNPARGGAELMGGTGGGGGGASRVSAAGAGGAAGGHGSGGGGGGASLNGFASGAGGTGADGLAIIITR